MEIYNRYLPTTKQLQYFLAVCEEQSFHKAASKMGISQPPLSIQIKELESKLGIPLFFRNPQQVLLTKEGQLVRDKANKILYDLALLTALFKTNPSNKVVLGMTKTIGFDFISKFKQFFMEFPELIKIYKNNYTSKELLTEQQKGNIDIVFIADYQLTEYDVEALLVHQEPMVLVLPDSHHACHHERIDLNDVHDLPLFWFARHQHPSFYDRCEPIFRNLSPTFIRQTELPDTLPMLLDVSLGNSMMLLPQSMAHAIIPGVVYKRLTDEYEKILLINIYLVWKTNKVNSTTQLIVDYFKHNPV